MAIRQWTLVMGLLSCGVTHLWAAPPTSLKVAYDVAKKSLHVSAAHPSDKLDKHYLRRIVIKKNGVEDKAVTLPRQKIPAGIDEDIAYEAKGGDKISVEVFCSQGGMATGDVTVPVPPKDETQE